MFFAVGSLCISLIHFLYPKLSFLLYIRATPLLTFCYLMGWEELLTHKFTASFRLIYVSQTSDLTLEAMCCMNVFLNVCECVWMFICELKVHKLRNIRVLALCVNFVYLLVLAALLFILFVYTSLFSNLRLSKKPWAFSDPHWAILLGSLFVICSVLL